MIIRGGPSDPMSTSWVTFFFWPNNGEIIGWSWHQTSLPSFSESIEMKECDRKRVFVIVLFIIGHTRNRAQGTPGRMPNSGYSDQTQPTLQRKSNRDSGSSVERMADGDQKQQVVHPARRMEGHVPRSPSGRTLRRDQSWRRWNRSQGNHWSLERSQDRCGTLDPVQACPDGRRAHACS